MESIKKELLYCELEIARSYGEDGVKLHLRVKHNYGLIEAEVVINEDDIPINGSPIMGGIKIG